MDATSHSWRLCAASGFVGFQKDRFEESPARYSIAVDYAVFALVLILLLIATVIDLRWREIPDWIGIMIGATAIASSWMGWLRITPLGLLLGGLLGLSIGWFLFRFAQLGGGDAKLIASLGLLLGPAGLLLLLFGMAIAGGVLAVVSSLRGHRDFAYAPAITAGFVWYLGIVLVHTSHHST